ncbi:MAG TPA: hypothetical protein VIN60_06970 [Anaerolineales bacterium]
MPKHKWHSLALSSSFQFFHFRLQKFYLLPQQLILPLQYFILLPHALIIGQYLSQLLLQFRKLVSIPSRYDVHQFTIRAAFLARAFHPIFSKTFNPLQNYAFAR